MSTFSSNVKMNLFLDELAPLRRKPARFVLSSGLVFVALLLSLLVRLVSGAPAALVFALTVVTATALCGLFSGFCTAILAVLALDYFFVPPVFAFNFDLSTLRLSLGFAGLTVATHVIERCISSRLRSSVKPPLGVHGALDGIDAGDIYGWAFDADNPASPVFVDVFANKRPIAHVAAVYYRPDVASRMECSGQHGFYVALPETLRTDSSALIEVKLPDGQPLAHSPQLFTVGTRKRSKSPTVLFVHIPKTAGTAFREAIAANFTQSEIAYIYPTPPGFLVPDLRALPLEQRRAFRVVIGHFQYGMHEALPQATEYITMVREPTARIRSHYAFLRDTQPDLLRQDSRFLSLEELFETRLSVDFDNALVRCFSGVDEREIPPGKLTRDIFDQAVRNLRGEFAFVGHQESSASAYADLQNRYGWHASSDIAIVNRGAPAVQVALNPGLSAVVQRFNQWDFLFYEEIVRRFPR